MKRSRSELHRVTACVTLLGIAGGAAAQIAFDQPPELLSNPSGRAPLAAAVVFATGEAVEARLAITDGRNNWQAEFDASVGEEGRYTIPVVGMRPERDHEITLTVTGDGGEPHVQVWTHTTPPLPANPLEFPELDVQVSIPDRMEPG